MMSNIVILEIMSTDIYIIIWQNTVYKTLQIANISLDIDI